MSATQKPRGDAKLKTLPPERREAIADYLSSHTVAQTAEWLRADGIQVSSGTLSKFWSWWRLGQQLRENESTVSQVLADLKESDPGLSEEALERAGQMFFSALAIQQQDSLTWKRAQDAKTRLELVRQNTLRLKRETCELFLKWSADQRAKEIAAGAEGNEVKIDRLYQLMFGEERK